MELLAFFGGIFLIFGLTLYVLHALEKRRTQEMQAIALKNGYDFFETDPGYSNIVTSANYKLMNTGHTSKIRNILSMKKEIEIGVNTLSGMEMIFDYSYSNGSGNNNKPRKQTVISYKSEGLSLPSFYLQEEGFGSKIIAKLVGIKDINFEKYPKFSNKYILSGCNEEEIREFFDDSLLRFFENFQDSIRVETSNNSVMIYVYDIKLKESDIITYSAVLERVVKILKLRSQGN